VSDQVIAKRNANALIHDVEPSFPVLPNRPMLLTMLAEFKQANGGLWVGGKAVLTQSALEFSPNAVNRSLQKGHLDIRIPLPEITAVTVEPAAFTNIVVIAGPGFVFKVRCYRAEKFAEQIRTANLGVRLPLGQALC
jgi:hypothetical protein